MPWLPEKQNSSYLSSYISTLNESKPPRIDMDIFYKKSKFDNFLEVVLVYLYLPKRLEKNA
jgi:hypothetical protein